jgi:hypothetical protein
MKKLLLVTALILATTSPPTVFSRQALNLDYSTYLGGSGWDEGHGISLGSDGKIFIVGWTASDDFPLKNSYQAWSGESSNVFVTALTSTGSAIFYSTYLGGSSSDYGDEISLGTDGVAYVTGKTNSSDFPTANPYQAVYGGNGDVFVSALSSTGSTIFYSTYIGGSNIDEGCGVSLGIDGAAYITGYTASYDFPTKNPYQTGYMGGISDAFVSALSPSGSDLSYSTYLGGSREDCGRDISLGMNGNAYVTGQTYSYYFPAVNPYQANYGGDGDAFVSALTTTGSSLVYSTYIGGNNDDHGCGISLGADGTTHVTGWTSSTNFPAKNPYQVSNGGRRDIFVSALSSTGSALYYSTYLGGSGNDEGYGIGLGTDGKAFITGWTGSGDFPLENSYQESHHYAFVSALSSTGSALYYSTYIGGWGYDCGWGISLRGDGAAYVTGFTSSPDFPIKNPYQAEISGSGDVFVVRLTLISVAPPWITDYNGDGTSDIAIFRANSGLWAIRGISRLYFGATGDDPQPGDYDGDGTTDIGLFRPSSGLWALRGVSRVYFGGSTDDPIPADYDGDGTTDPAIFRSSSGLWAVRGITELTSEEVRMSRSRDTTVVWDSPQSPSSGHLPDSGRSMG